MNILFLNHNIIGRGTYWRCLGLARALVARGSAVTLLTAAGETQLKARTEDREGVKIVITPRLGPPGIHDGGFAPVDILYRLGWILKNRFDIVHAFAHRPNVALPWLFNRKWSSGTRFFADWDDWWTRGGITTPRRRWKALDTIEAEWLEERLPQLAEGVSVASTVLQKRALGLGIPDKKILLLPQGANTETIRVEDRRECKVRLGLPPDAPVINFSGYAVWDVKVLLEAFQKVRQKEPEAILQIIGYDKDGQLPQMIASSPDHRSIVERGQVPFEQMSYYLGSGDVQALPMLDRLDNQARWPIKLGEYLASGRPVVMQAVGDGAKLVSENDLGKVTGQSAEQLAEGLLSLLCQPQIASDYGKRARVYAENHLQWAERAASLETWYQQ